MPATLMTISAHSTPGRRAARILPPWVVFDHDHPYLLAHLFVPPSPSCDLLYAELFMKYENGTSCRSACF